MKVLFLSHNPMPYRVKFFNLLAQSVSLTVVYQLKESKVRDKTWQNSVEISHPFTVVDNPLSLAHLIINNSYDLVVVGCYNQKLGIAAIEILRWSNIPFLINVDGEFFISRFPKRLLVNSVISGGYGYLVGGMRTGTQLSRMFPNKTVYHYPFTSLTCDEVRQNAAVGWKGGSRFLCVAQFIEAKGVDVLVRAMRLLPEEQLTIVGSLSNTTQLINFIEEQNVGNIDVVPFMGKEELACAYLSCKGFVLPSRQECWGLVINEAASFGAPIVSTRGSGAALDYLAGEWERFLADPGDCDSLARALNDYVRMDDVQKKTYSKYLMNLSKNYTIEAMVDAHLAAFESVLSKQMR